MINYSDEEIFEKISYAKKNQEAYFFKKFISEDALPNWKDFLNCIYEVQKQDRSYQFTNNNNMPEETIGNLLITEKIHFAPQAIEYFDYFNLINKDIKILNEIFKINFGFGGPKICLGNFTVGLHFDKWDAVNIQCEGKTIWNVSDNNFKETYEMERGDLLFFPEGMKHSVESSTARANLVFNYPNILENIDLF